jgi:hypothetical protein
MRGMTEERLTWHFENWAEWQRDQRTDFGWGFENADGSGAISGSSREFDAMVDEADMRCAQALDAILDGLPPIQSCAVYHRYIAAVFSFHRALLDQALILAREAVRLGLMRRGID